jgi:Sodium/hydrogen exchanger family
MKLDKSSEAMGRAGDLIAEDSPALPVLASRSCNILIGLLKNAMNETLFTIMVFIALLLVASGVAMATKWVRVPYTLALTIVGLVISPMHFLPVVHISPELILLIFLPALLFEAAWNLKLDHLRQNWLPIIALAVIGVAASVGVVGAVIHFGIGLAWPAAMLFGALPGRSDLVVMVFGAVIFSLLVQGLTIALLLKRLRLRREPGLMTYELLQGRLLAETAAITKLDDLRNRGMVVEQVYQTLHADLSRSQHELSRRLEELDAGGDVEEEQRRRLQHHLINEKKASLASLLREGLLSEEVYQELSVKLDEDLTKLPGKRATSSP